MQHSHIQTFPIWKHPYFFRGVFIVFLCVGFIIRYALFYQNFNIEDGDITSVYHIANHIITYKEFPILGEPNSIYTLLPHSPLYFYITALGLLAHNSVFTLGLIGLLLQLIYIVIMYRLAFVLFNQSVALLTGLLLIGNQQFIAQTQVMYQRWYEQPLFAASYLLLALAYIKKRRVYVLYASVSFTLALGLGLHGYAALPAFLLLLILTLYKIHAPMHVYFATATLMLGLWITCYATVLTYLNKNNHLLFALLEPVYVTSITHYVQECIQNIGRLFYGTFYSDLLPSLLRVGAISIFLCTVAIAAFRRRIKYSPYFLILSVSIFSVILIASLLGKDTRDYHFVAIFGPFVLLLAALTQSFGQKTKSDKIKTILCTALLLVIGAPSVQFLQKNQQKNHVYMAQSNAVGATIPYIQQLQKQHGDSWANQTTIESYGKTISGRYDPTDNTFWPLFEKVTQTRLSDTTTGFTIPLTKTPTNIFVICENYKTIESATNECQIAFLTRHPNFSATLIYSADPDGKYFIYLGQKTGKNSIKPN